MITPTILRSEALRQIDSGEPFTLEFVACDRKRGSGGQLIEVKGWVKMKGDAVQVEKTGTAPTTTTRKRPIKIINIYNPTNRLQHPIGVHVLLLQSFNGKRITNG